MLLWGSRNLGVPYDATRRQDPNRFDCSSFVSSGITAAGLDISSNGVLPDTSSMLASGTGPGGFLQAIDVSDVKPGDLLFWGPPQFATGHVVMVLEDGYVMHAPRAGSVTSIAKLSGMLSVQPLCARRIISRQP